ADDGPADPTDAERVVLATDGPDGPDGLDDDGGLSIRTLLLVGASIGLLIGFIVLLLGHNARDRETRG
ncbi:MAG: hypothetical protein WEB09_03385, partial [Nitriliruptor sp.]